MMKTNIEPAISIETQTNNADIENILDEGSEDSYARIKQEN